MDMNDMAEIDLEDVITVEEMEWKKIKDARFKEGYVEGKYVGSETAKESGEHHGYVIGLTDTFNDQLSVIMGLLGVNQCILLKTKSPLLPRAKEIKVSLDDFRKRFNALRMMEVDFRDEGNRKESTDDFEIEDENLNVPNTPAVNGSSFNSTRSQHITIIGNKTLEDLCRLKAEILDFLNECNQPLILDQIKLEFSKIGTTYLHNPVHVPKMSSSHPARSS